MTWGLFRWTWQLESPLYIGMPPAGSLNRTRVYVPARVLWGALTAELARHESVSAMPNYEEMGEELRDIYRLTYLYPAEQVKGQWQAWLPEYRAGEALRWVREDDASAPGLSERAFRRRLLHTRPGTAIDASTDAAEEGSLRETECLQMSWRNERGHAAGAVAMVGYVFIKTANPKKKYSRERTRLEPIQRLFLGGDTRYGLGQVRREGIDRAGRVFGKEARVDGSEPEIASERVLAHAMSENANGGMAGAQELVLGWDRGTIQDVAQASRLWSPGSRTVSGEPWWKLDSAGRWESLS